MERTLSTIKELEKALESRLGPVAPSREFVNKLSEKLRNDPGIIIEHKQTPAILIALVAGLLFGAFFFYLFKKKKSL